MTEIKSRACARKKQSSSRVTTFGGRAKPPTLSTETQNALLFRMPLVINITKLFSDGKLTCDVRQTKKGFKSWLRRRVRDRVWSTELCTFLADWSFYCSLRRNKFVRKSTTYLSHRQNYPPISWKQIGISDVISWASLLSFSTMNLVKQWTLFSFCIMTVLK